MHTPHPQLPIISERDRQIELLASLARLGKVAYFAVPPRVETLFNLGYVNLVLCTTTKKTKVTVTEAATAVLARLAEVKPEPAKPVPPELTFKEALAQGLCIEVAAMKTMTVDELVSTLNKLQSS
jgi:hypothetical protein